MKEFTLIKLLKNDVQRSLDRVQLILNKKQLKDLVKGKGFDHTGNNEILSVLIMPFLFLIGVVVDLSLSYVVVFSLLCLIILNRHFLKYLYCLKGLKFTFLSFLFLVIDVWCIFFALIYGVILQAMKIRSIMSASRG